MKVKELITKLQDENQELEVAIEYGLDCYKMLDVYSSYCGKVIIEMGKEFIKIKGE